MTAVVENQNSGFIEPTKTVPEMTYYVFSGTLNPTHFTSLIEPEHNRVFRSKQPISYIAF